MSKTDPQYHLSVLPMDTHEYPQFVESKREEHVAFGKDDDYPQYLHELYSTVSIHCAIINTTSDMIAGRGMRPEAIDERWVKFNELVDKKTLRCLAFDLKLSGNAYLIGTWSNDRTEVARLEYEPYHHVRAGKCNENGDVTHYFVKADWDSKDDPQRIPVFDKSETGKVNPLFIYHIRRHDPQAKYYGVPDYLGGTQEMELDKSIRQFHLNNIKNGMFPSFHFAFHNGQPNEEQQAEIERKVKQKFSGSQKVGAQLFTYDVGGGENALDINPIEANGNHDMFAHLAEQTNSNILAAHGVTSPLLFGVRGETGFGSNSEELEVALKIYQQNRVYPMRELLLDAFEDICGIQLNVQDNTPLQTFSKSDVATWLTDRGEDEPEGYEVLFSHPVEYDLEDDLNQSLETFEALELARTVRSAPGKNSEQDTSLFKIRYRYESTNTALQSSREFCRRMETANKIYRKEDIIAAGDQAVNPGWGPNGANTYSIWKFKGGGNCQHRWVRVVYLKSGGQISANEARRMILKLPITQRAAARWEQNEPEVNVPPRFLPKQGFLK